MSSIINYNLSRSSKSQVYVDATGGKERFNNVRITFINGILNSEEDCRTTAMEISCHHGFNNVHFVHDKSHGFVKDAYRTAKFIHSEDLIDEAELELSELWDKLINDMGGHQNPQSRIYHYAHSRGGLVTERALELLSSDQRKKMVVCSLGSPAFIDFSDCAKVENIQNTMDPVPFSNHANIHLHMHTVIPSESFGMEHGILDSAYANVLKKRGKSLLKEQLVNSPKVEKRVRLSIDYFTS